MAAEIELPNCTGIEKAAIILLALGDEAGGEILGFLDPDEITRLSTAMVRLGAVSGSLVNSVVESFFQSLGEFSFDMGGVEQTERLLRRALPEDMVKIIMHEVSNASGVDIWRKLSNIDRGVLVSYLRGEHPQTIAVILSQLSAEVSSRILKSFERKLATDVISRMLRMQPVQTEALNRIEETLRVDFLATTANRRRQDSHAGMAEIFNHFDGRTETELLASLGQVNSDSADRIQNLMFTFKDLAKFDSAALQTIIHAVERDVLARGLKSAPDAMKKLFLGNMSTRSAKRLEDDWVGMAQLSRGEIETAQATMLRVTKGLIERGEIRSTREKEDEDEFEF